MSDVETKIREKTRRDLGIIDKRAKNHRYNAELSISANKFGAKYSKKRTILPK